MEFYRHYLQLNLAGPAEQETKLDLIREEPKERREESGVPGPNSPPTNRDQSIKAILKSIWVPALSVCFIFTVTIGLFPAVTAEVESSIEGTSSWSKCGPVTPTPTPFPSQAGFTQSLKQNQGWGMGNLGPFCPAGSTRAS